MNIKKVKTFLSMKNWGALKNTSKLSALSLVTTIDSYQVSYYSWWYLGKLHIVLGS